jgi:hypothetical protein
MKNVRKQITITSGQDRLASFDVRPYVAFTGYNILRSVLSI